MEGNEKVIYRIHMQHVDRSIMSSDDRRAAVACKVYNAEATECILQT